MGKRGPKPEPTQLKILKGNPGKRPLNKSEPQPAPIKAPKGVRVPATLNVDGKRLWNYLYPKLVSINLLTELDLSAFEAMCTDYGEWKEILRKIKKEGRTKDLVRDVKYYETAFRQWSAEFGLSPSARSKMNLEKFSALSTNSTSDRTEPGDLSEAEKKYLFGREQVS